MRTALLTLSVCVLALPANAQYSGGSGTAEDPFQIATEVQMNAIGSNPVDWDKHFKLVADIDLRLYCGNAFRMIGVSSSDGQPFSGVFNGNGMRIVNFTYSVSTTVAPGIGLFGAIGGSAIIKNLTLENVNVAGGTNGIVGALVGVFEGGSISNCHIDGGAVSGQWTIGGLAGSCDGRIENCSSSASVSVTDMEGGGLIGSNRIDGTVIKCFSAGLVSARSNAGGLVGQNNGTISDCYSTAEAAGTKGGAGGLTVLNYGVIRNCYSAGRVSAPQIVGGLVGGLRGGAFVTDSYWDVQTSGQSTSQGGVGRTTAEMKKAGTFVGWDLENVWIIDEGVDYPKLRPGNPPEPAPVVPATYAGGSGTANDPYEIATAADLILLGDHPEDYDKHFILTADVDLDPSLPGNKVFDRAVIASSQLTPFAGMFDGAGHTISHLTIDGRDSLGLFGYLASEAEIKSLEVANVSIVGAGSLGALVAHSSGASVTSCHSSGTIHGSSGRLGGLVGQNGGLIARCRSTVLVSGSGEIGGLTGYNGGTVFLCYSAGTVSGSFSVGGLVGLNQRSLVHCYSRSDVDGDTQVGGLVGRNYSSSAWGDYDNLTCCYSVGAVAGSSDVGGLVGYNERGGASLCFWDIQTSGRVTGDVGTGLTTLELQKADTFAEWESDAFWTIDEGNDYPRLWWEHKPGIRMTDKPFDGSGYYEDDPHTIVTADQLDAVGLWPSSWDKHFRLAGDLDMSGLFYDRALIAPDANMAASGFQGTAFTGVFDGGGHTILRLRIVGGDYVGLFGRLAATAEVKNLAIMAVDITGLGAYAGGLAGSNSGNVVRCYSSGSVYCTETDAGGLLGINHGSVSECFSDGSVASNLPVAGGLVGFNSGCVTQSYSGAAVSALISAGGLVGENWGQVIHCYSTGSASGFFNVGGLVGGSFDGAVTASFWDTQTSRLTGSAGGTGETTAEMQMAATFLDAGWDFVGETANGTQDIWWIDEGQDYPRLQWEAPRRKYGGGRGTADDPYQIWTPEQMNAIGASPADWSRHFKLMADIDLSAFDGKEGRPAFNLIGPDTNPATWYYDWDAIPFTGVFDGNGHTISGLTLVGYSHVGLFCYLDAGAEIRNLGVVDVNVAALDSYAGGLVGYNLASLVTQCYSTGVVNAGQVHVGGLIGYNRGSVTHSYSTATVVGDWLVGGLTGDNYGTVIGCYSAGGVTARSTWPSQAAGGLIPGNWGTVTDSLWDTETSGQTTSDGGTGKTTAEMQTASTFLDAGWDFMGETDNGTEDIWWILEGQDYPRLWWELDEMGVDYDGTADEQR